MVFLVLAFDTATIIPLEAFAIFYTTVYSILPSLAGGLSLSISQIAEACGFSDYNYFIAVFSRLTGMPPRKYRVLQGQGGSPAHSISPSSAPASPRGCT